MTKEQQYARLGLLMAMVAAWPLTGLAAAGLVQFAAGDVQLKRGDATSALAKGAELDGGDVVVTGAAGRAQIRFSDGGLVALYPDSQFTVSRYADGAGTGEDHFVVQLLRGGLRAITGLIGKRHPANYRVVTPTAVVGIRGSAFLLAIDANGQVVVSGEQDEIEVCTQAGCVGVKAGESVLVVSEQMLPVYIHTRALLPVPDVTTPQMAGDQLDVLGRRAYVYIIPAPVAAPEPGPALPPGVPSPAPPPAGTPAPGQGPGTTVPAPAPTPATPAPTPTTPPPPTRGPTTPAPPATPTPTPPPPVVRPPIVFVPVVPIFRLPPPPPPAPIIR